MKRIALLILLISLAAVAVMAQSIDLQLAVTTQALTRDMLKELNLTESEIRNILRLQVRAQVETYQRIRGERGEESWARLMQQVRAQARAQTQSRPQTAVRSSRPETAPSSAGGSAHR